MTEPTLRPIVLAAIVIALASGCSRSASKEAPQPAAASTPATAPAGTAASRPYLLETVDDAAVVQLYADGFTALPLQQKTLIWHLYQAALAGRDIFYDQKHREALAMRGVLDAIVSHPQGIDPATLADVQRYAKLFWINSGPYNNLTARKFVLRVSPQAFATAAKTAAASGATFPTASGESLDALLARLQPMFFDPNVDPIVTNKTPGAGKDILTSSANNLYAGGVTMADLRGFDERHGLNSRLVKRGGTLTEEVYSTHGRYAAQLTRVVQHLREAIPYATAPMADALRALIRFYETGEREDRVKYDIAWVRDQHSPVDAINGFIEVYLDPRGIKGAWESVVEYVNQEKTARIHMIADHAQWFEDHMPYAPQYRKPRVTGIVANAVDAVIETGDAGPVTPIGINLPNDDRIREQYGSKSVSLANVIEAYDRSSPPSMRNEFSWNPEEASRAQTFSTIASELHTDMHEVIGHASGRQSDALKTTPQEALKEFFSALEEGRADLVALYFIGDPELAAIGAVPAADQAQIALTSYESYTRNALVQLRRVREGTQLEESHMRNRQLVIRWLMANTKAIDTRHRDGKTFYVVTDPAAFREGVGRLLAEVQRIKSEGDYPAAKRLFDAYGIHFDPALRDEVVQRVDALKLPSYSGFVMPELTPVMDAKGAITDVTISYPLDLTKQMLAWDAATP
jgi:dipeptidyl-peptidase-3